MSFTRPVAAFRRGLPAITLDLATARQRIAALNVRNREDEGDAWNALTDRRDALEREFSAEFRRVTGVEFSTAAEVMS